MAIDTADKRGSTIGAGLDSLTVLPAPNLAIDAGDKMQTAAVYRGISSGAPVLPSTTGHATSGLSGFSGSMQMPSAFRPPIGGH